MSDDDTVGACEWRESRVARALELLREARDELAAAGAPGATDAVRRALKSAEGALRHARRATDRARSRARS